jgi:hypothetical protein
MARQGDVCPGCGQAVNLAAGDAVQELIPADSEGDDTSVLAHLACTAALVDSGDWEIL